jgi:hypothetical protein
MVMLDDETLTVEQAGIEDSQHILIEGTPTPTLTLK